MHLMTLPGSFNNLAVKNRLGQTIQLPVYHIKALGREYVFVTSPVQNSSSVVAKSIIAKNAEHFAFQLRERFHLDARRFEMIEVQGNMPVPVLWRWRFEWVGASPISPRCEAVTSPGQYLQLLSLLNVSDQSEMAAG
jgi:hypothetical protein